MTQAVEATDVVPTSNTNISLIENVDVSAMTKELNAIKSFQQTVQTQLVKNQDFGVIPGTQKPTLLKPGAEKILMIMGLQSEYEVVSKQEDFNEGFFAYTVRARLIKQGEIITEGLGAANTKESRYHNQDKFTIQNTVLKMAKKRAQIDATLTVASLSNVFTQDIEDMGNFNKREQMETMTDGDAGSMKLTFGKYKGKTLGEAAKENKGYVGWLIKNARDESVRKAAEMVLNPPKSKPKTQVKPSTPTDKKPADKVQATSKPAPNDSSNDEEISKNIDDIVSLSKKLAILLKIDQEDPANKALEKAVQGWTESGGDWDKLTLGQTEAVKKDLQSQMNEQHQQTNLDDGLDWQTPAPSDADAPF